MFREILNKAQQPFDREPYQIVFFWHNGIMRLRFDALTWFDYVLPTYNVQAEDRASIGSKYVSQCITEKHKKDGNRRPLNCKDRYPPTTIKENTCLKKQCDCLRVHIPASCEGVINCINGNRVGCGQYFDRCTSIYSFLVADKQFMLHSRSESTRDIILFPVNHKNNEAFATEGSTWEVIAKVEKELRNCISKIKGEQITTSLIESVFFNFGSWTTVMSKNKLAKTAHAHVHLVLTADAISILSSSEIRLKGENKDNRYVLNLTGCYRDPTDYEYSDAITLQNSRLFYYHIKETEKCIRDIKTDLHYLKENIVTKNDLQNLFKGIFTDDLLASLNARNSPSSDLSNNPTLTTVSSFLHGSDHLESPPETTADITSSQQTVSTANSNNTAPLKLSRGQKKEANKKKKLQKG
ncbi:unnamed protein product [Rotaria socialis]|uniref:Uncharacterized protein n=2 Tax=Rotaria socialis TaxID=392032 RepID=A0A821D104_9BILA|nr:unnamed protein product [Rotaria socialis]